MLKTVLDSVFDFDTSDPGSRLVRASTCIPLSNIVSHSNIALNYDSYNGLVSLVWGDLLLFVVHIHSPKIRSFPNSPSSTLNQRVHNTHI